MANRGGDKTMSGHFGNRPMHFSRWLATIWILLLAISTILSPSSAVPARAQDIPPEVLQKLLEQRAARQGQTVATPSPVDQARRGEQNPNATPPAEKAASLSPSPLEQDYARRLSQRTISPALRQFGYDLFARVSPPQPMLGRLPDSYMLGIGDELVIALVGSTNRLVTTAIDREGNVLISELPPIRAAGLSLGEFRKALREQVAKTLLGTEAYVSVGELRVITVTVVGEVGAPGLYHVPSLTDLIGVLGTAGGIAKTGSLRQVTILSRNGARRTVDLYDVLEGRKADLKVRDGDRIFVPVIGPTVAVSGDVKRPGIYELQAADRTVTVARVLALAGGALRARGNLIQRYRLDDEGRQHVARVNAESTVSPSDIYIVRPERALNVGHVALVGHVRQPGERALAAAASVSALLQNGEALGPQPYLPFAVLETEDPATRQRLYRPLDLTPILAGVSDISLKDRDRLFVFGMADISYLASPVVRATVLSPKDATSRRCPALTLLAQRVRQADNERFANILRSVFVTRDDQQVPGLSEKKGEGQSEELAAAAEAAADEVVTETELRQAAHAPGSCNAFYDRYPDLLPLALEYATVAIGAVRRPGLYPFAESASLRDLVAAGGGLSRSADITRIEITNLTPDNKRLARGVERRYVDLHDSPMADIILRAGDIVRFSARQIDAEPGTVLIAGEVRFPGVYTIEKGETLLSVLERAGGLTPEAYPFGAVFTRERVKQKQQEGFRRTARELNNALALAALKRDTRGEALTAAAQLARSFATIEAAGRIVIEADPTVLRAHPELDTVLEAGDTLYIPKRPNFVLVIGDVLNPGALQFSPDKTVEDYIDEAGGFQLTADKGRAFIVYPNGVAQPVHVSSWLRESITVPPGTTIVVPKDVDPLKTLDLVRDITQVLSQLAVSAASIAVISRR